jgi:hypothetical protein
MKFRAGFVSNSSSSSFIIGVKEPLKKIMVTVEIDINPYVEKAIKTEQDLFKYFQNEYGEHFLQEDAWSTKMYNKCLSSIRNGETILVGSFTNEGGEYGEALLCDHGIPKNTKGINIIHSEGGY